MSTSSDKRHRVLIVGVGSIGERHLRCFLRTGRRDAAIVEPNDSVRESVATRYGVRDHFSTLDAALADSSAGTYREAVIATPAPLHVPTAARLVAAGIHTLIEKPLSVSLEGVDDLGRIARARNVTVGTAYVLRHHPLLQRLKEHISTGEFGAPLQLIVVSGQHFPTYRPAYREIYYATRATGGGAIQDTLTHLVNVGDWLVGPVDRVVADAERLRLEGVEVEDTVHLLARHGSLLASYSLNQHQAPNETTITLVCENATLRCEMHEFRLGIMKRPDEPWTFETLPPIERDAIFVAQAEAFLDAAETGGRPDCDLEEGERTLRVNLAALASLESGAWVSTKPAEFKS